MRKRLEVLENELEELRESNKSSWDMWGTRTVQLILRKFMII